MFSGRVWTANAREWRDIDGVPKSKTGPNYHGPNCHYKAINDTSCEFKGWFVSEYLLLGSCNKFHLKILGCMVVVKIWNRTQYSSKKLFCPVERVQNSLAVAKVSGNVIISLDFCNGRTIRNAKLVWDQCAISICAAAVKWLCYDFHKVYSMFQVQI